MKVIDLLNKIANGEIKYPIKWKYYGTEYEIEDEASLEDFHCMYNTLNDEIEIIEEPKKIEKIDISSGVSVVNVAYKLNEIIDYINKGDSNEC